MFIRRHFNLPCNLLSPPLPFAYHMFIMLKVPKYLLRPFCLSWFYNIFKLNMGFDVDLPLACMFK